MKKVQIIIPILLFILLVSCENSVSSEMTINKARAVTVENVSSNSNSISLTSIASWGSPCGYFSHYTVSQDRKDIFITVYGQQVYDAVCLTVMSSFEAPVKIMINGSGEYNLHFWQTDSTSLDTTITVL